MAVQYLRLFALLINAKSSTLDYPGRAGGGVPLEQAPNPDRESKDEATDDEGIHTELIDPDDHSEGPQRKRPGLRSISPAGEDTQLARELGEKIPLHHLDQSAELMSLNLSVARLDKQVITFGRYRPAGHESTSWRLLARSPKGEESLHGVLPGARILLFSHTFAESMSEEHLEEILEDQAARARGGTIRVTFVLSQHNAAAKAESLRVLMTSLSTNVPASGANSALALKEVAGLYKGIPSSQEHILSDVIRWVEECQITSKLDISSVQLVGPSRLEMNILEAYPILPDYDNQVCRLPKEDEAYMFHGSSVKAMVAILNSGHLMRGSRPIGDPGGHARFGVFLAKEPFARTYAPPWSGNRGVG